MRLIDADAFKEYICNAYEQVKHMYPDGGEWARQITEDFCKDIDDQPTIEPQPTQLTDDDKETIRIHLSSFKESLCNQRRWNEAKEYEELISRLLSTSSVQPRKGKWIKINPANIYECSECGKNVMTDDISAYDFCHGCGAEMREGDAK